MRVCAGDKWQYYGNDIFLKNVMVQKWIFKKVSSTLAEGSSWGYCYTHGWFCEG